MELFPNAGNAIATGTNNALRILQAQKFGNELNRQNVLTDTAKQSSSSGSYDPEQHAKLLEQNGLMREAFDLRKLARSEANANTQNTLNQLGIAAKTLELLAVSAPLIRDQQQYNNLKSGIEENKIIPSGILPETWDKNAQGVLMQLGKNAADKFEVLTGDKVTNLGFDKGTVVQKNTKTNKIDVLQKPDKEKDKNNVRELTVKEKQEKGFHEKDIVQIDGKGKINVVREFKPKDTSIDNAISNNIGKQVATFFDGFYDPITNEIKVNQNDAVTANKIRADAERIYTRADGKLTPAEAVREAAKQNGINSPTKPGEDNNNVINFIDLKK